LDEINFHSKWKYDFNVRSVMLTFSHSFGNKKLEKVDIKSGSEEERNRVR
jgi:hypothetical protein